MSTHPIDIVIPWVDGSDPVWQADHAKYRASKSADNHPARYREWGLFRYWFRGIEQNAPWVRKVHLLTYGHLPAWLEPDHPKLHIVNGMRAHWSCAPSFFCSSAAQSRQKPTE